MGISLDELLIDNSSAIKIQDTAGDELGINADGSIDVNILGGVNVEVDLDHADDSVRLGDGTTLTTVTSNGGKDGLDVNLINTSIAVTATDLDIRDLSASQDNVAISDGTDTLAINADGSINVNFSSSVGDDDPYTENPLAVGGRGVSGALTALSASNDKYDLLGDLYRRTWVNTSRNIAILNTAATVTTTAAEVLASPLAGRREVTIQNEGNSDVYVGSSAGVTSANGIKISKNSSATFEWGEDINIFMIAASGSQDVRFLEAG